MQHKLNETCFKVKSIKKTSWRTETVQQSILIQHGGGSATGAARWTQFSSGMCSCCCCRVYGKGQSLFFCLPSSSWHKATSYLKEKVSKR